MTERPVVFAGPSLYGTGLDTSAASGIDWRAPARRGDVERLVRTTRGPGVIGLADGTFHAYPSVSHVELRKAMQRGWRIYGLCSMGAIRACEMQQLGMRPWGRVAEMFCRDPAMPDDEVALLHGAAAPFLPLSEPMVHIRAFCAWARAGAWLDAEQSDAVLAVMRERWYGERTLANLRRELAALLHQAELPGEWMDAIQDFGPFRLKQADLRAFVAARPWLDTCSETAV